MADPQPQAPQITPIPVSQAPANDGFDQISAALDNTVKVANTPLPPQYIPQAQIAEPRMPYQIPFGNNANTHNQPVTNQATEIARARTRDHIGSIANLVGTAGKLIQDKKMQGLKADLKEVMTAKQNIANAQVVLKQDPTNKDAQEVIASNKKSMEAILTDPKKQKQLTKALDISYTDPEKNKTPEVKALQDAQKEHKEAGAFTSDNPKEHAIAQAAANGGKAPESTQGQQAQPQPQQAPKSQTPYADAAISKDLVGLTGNPQYASALKQKEDAEKQINQYIIPKMIQAATLKNLETMKQGGANARANLKAATDYGKYVADNLAKTNIADINAKARIKSQGMRDQTALAQTSMKVKAMLQVAEDNRFSKVQQEMIKGQAKGVVVDQLKSTLAEMKGYETQRLSIQADPSLSDQQKKDKTAEIDALQEINQAKLEALNGIVRENKIEQQDPTIMDYFKAGMNYITGNEKQEKQEKDDANVGDKSTGDSESELYKQFVGSDESDEPGVAKKDDDEDSDSYP